MSKVSKNILYNGLGQGLSVLLGLLAVRFVFRRLGGDALGLIYLSLAFSGALSAVVQLGICESAVREVASSRARGSEYIKAFIRTSSLFYWTGYLSLAIVTYTLAPWLVRHWVRLDTLDAAKAIAMMRILSLGALVALPGGLYRALLVGLQHQGLTNLIDVSAKGLQQGGIFLILLAHGSLFGVAYWIAASMTAQVVVYGVVCARRFSIRALLPGFSRAVVQRNVGYASSLMTITLCAWVLTQADKVIVSKLLPLASLGIYTFARGVIQQGMLLTGAINNAIFPHFSALYGAGKTGELKSAYHKIHDFICCATVPVFAAVPFAAIPLFSYLFDLRSARLLLLPVTFLCIGYYMNGTLTAPYVVSLAVGRPGIVAKQNAVALFVVVPASVVAIYFFGLSGAGFSWVIYHVFTYSYGLPRVCRECLEIQPRAWYRHVLRIMGSAALIYGAAWTVLAKLGGFSVSALATAYALATAIYCLVALRLMGGGLRLRIREFLHPLGLKGRALMVPE